ncbi:MAG TPA: 50S ribosomal protein L29 [Methanoregulaceae archaeon]|jgi:large subunit ribosomal protein L29|nr:50S ribosomal protein L29 [Methanoregulaceae archaeon]
MAIFRAKDVRELSDVELQEQMDKIKLELIQHYGKVSAGGSTENPGRIKELRRTVARMMTEQNRRRTV